MKLGVIGGSGLYEMEGMEEIEEITLDTPFGKPSDAYIKGKLDGAELYFLPRHGRGHWIMPSEINYRANIFGFKLLGVERVNCCNSGWKPERGTEAEGCCPS